MGKNRIKKILIISILMICALFLTSCNKESRVINKIKHTKIDVVGLYDEITVESLVFDYLNAVNSGKLNKKDLQWEKTPIKDDKGDIYNENMGIIDVTLKKEKGIGRVRIPYFIYPKDRLEFSPETFFFYPKDKGFPHDYTKAIKIIEENKK